MKKIAFLTIGIIYSLNCTAQQTIAVNNAVHINLPDKAVKISKDQAISHATKKFHYDKMMLGTITNRDADIYKIDNILVSLHTENNSFKEGHLSVIKKGYDELFKGNSSFTSILKNVNNNSVLIINYLHGDIEHYTVFSINDNNSKAISVALEFDKSDASEAKIILDQLINSITFTE